MKRKKLPPKSIIELTEMLKNVVDLTEEDIKNLNSIKDVFVNHAKLCIFREDLNISQGKKTPNSKIYEIYQQLLNDFQAQLDLISQIISKKSNPINAAILTPNLRTAEIVELDLLYADILTQKETLEKEFTEYVIQKEKELKNTQEELIDKCSKALTQKSDKTEEFPLFFEQPLISKDKTQDFKGKEYSVNTEILNRIFETLQSKRTVLDRIRESLELNKELEIIESKITFLNRTGLFNDNEEYIKEYIKNNRTEIIKEYLKSLDIEISSEDQQIFINFIKKICEKLENTTTEHPEEVISKLLSNDFSNNEQTNQKTPLLYLSKLTPQELSETESINITSKEIEICNIILNDLKTRKPDDKNLKKFIKYKHIGSNIEKFIKDSITFIFEREKELIEQEKSINVYEKIIDFFAYTNKIVDQDKFIASTRNEIDEIRINSQIGSFLIKKLKSFKANQKIEKLNQEISEASFVKDITKDAQDRIINSTNNPLLRNIFRRIQPSIFCFLNQEEIDPLIDLFFGLKPKENLKKEDLEQEYNRLKEEKIKKQKQLDTINYFDSQKENQETNKVIVEEILNKRTSNTNQTPLISFYILKLLYDITQSDYKNEAYHQHIYYEVIDIQRSEVSNILELYLIIEKYSKENPRINSSNIEEIIKTRLENKYQKTHTHTS